MFIRALFSYVAAFFCVGMLLLPFTDVAALHNIGNSLGIASLIYGLESVIRVGHVTTCGGNLWGGSQCAVHSVRAAGLVLWPILFVVWQIGFPQWPARGRGDDSDD
jgi:hypothetical protein